MSRVAPPMTSAHLLAILVVSALGFCVLFTIGAFYAAGSTKDALDWERIAKDGDSRLKEIRNPHSQPSD